MFQFNFENNEAGVGVKEERFTDNPGSFPVYPVEIVDVALTLRTATRPGTFEEIPFGNGWSFKKTLLNLRTIPSANPRLQRIVRNSDLVPSIYEGGFKLWECSADLGKTALKSPRLYVHMIHCHPASHVLS